MSIPVKVVDSKKFDYAKFERDLRNSIKKKKSSMVWVSENICLRSPSYLATTVAEKRLPLKVVMAIANWAELDLREYEKKEEEKPKKVAPAEKKPEEKKEEEAPKTGWSCLVRVDEEFGMAMMIVPIFLENRSSNASLSENSNPSSLPKHIAATLEATPLDLTTAAFSTWPLD